MFFLRFPISNCSVEDEDLIMEGLIFGDKNSWVSGFFPPEIDFSLCANGVFERQRAREVAPQTRPQVRCTDVPQPQEHEEGRVRRAGKNRR